MITQFDFMDYLLKTVLPASGVASTAELFEKYTAKHGWQGYSSAACQDWLRGLPLACEFSTYNIAKLVGYNTDTMSEDDFAWVDKAYWQGLGAAVHEVLDAVNSANAISKSCLNFCPLENNEEYIKAQYDEMLDDAYFTECSALPVVISGSELLKRLDPTAYQCGLVDFEDSLDNELFDDYNDACAELDDINSVISEWDDTIQNES